LLVSEVPLEVPLQPLTQSAEVAEKLAERGDASPPTVGACLSAPLVLASARSCKPLPSAFCGFSLMRNPLGVGAAPIDTHTAGIAATGLDMKPMPPRRGA